MRFHTPLFDTSVTPPVEIFAMSSVCRDCGNTVTIIGAGDNLARMSYSLSEVGWIPDLDGEAVGLPFDICAFCESERLKRAARLKEEEGS